MARWVIFPASGTLIRVRMADPRTVLGVVVKRLDGFGPGSGAGGFFEKVAVTERSPRIRTVQVLALPEHAPPQPEKHEPAPGLAVRTTGVESGKVDEQIAPQLIPGGLEVTVPEPAPSVFTSSP